MENCKKLKVPRCQQIQIEYKENLNHMREVVHAIKNNQHKNRDKNDSII